MNYFKVKTKSALRYCVASLGHLYRPLEAIDRAPRVLCYHGICENPSNEWAVTPDQFHRQMQYIRDYCHPVTLDEILLWYDKKKSLPERAVAVTFDDGFQEICGYANSILDKFEIKAAVFIVTGLVGKNKSLSSKGFYFDRPMMDWSDIKNLHKLGWTIGSHSVTHPQLNLLSEAEVKTELSNSKDTLQQFLGEEIKFLAYPYGTSHTVTEREYRIAKEVGYSAAFMDMIAPLRLQDNRMALSRNKVLSIDNDFVFQASLSGRLDLWRLIEKCH